METLITVAIYARTSTDLQEKEHTIGSQLDALRKYAQDKGYQVFREYLDEGYSGATLDRPGLDRLRDDPSSGEFRIVLIHSPDRLARGEGGHPAGVPQLPGGRLPGEQNAPGDAGTLRRVRAG